MGLKATDLKRVVRSKQKPWMKNYIDEITEEKANSNTEFGKFFPKNMNC